jgi:hypothetical protein
MILVEWTAVILANQASDRAEQSHGPYTTNRGTCRPPAKSSVIDGASPDAAVVPTVQSARQYPDRKWNASSRYTGASRHSQSSYGLEDVLIFKITGVKTSEHGWHAKL